MVSQNLPALYFFLIFLRKILLEKKISSKFLKTAEIFYRKCVYLRPYFSIIFRIFCSKKIKNFKCGFTVKNENLKYVFLATNFKIKFPEILCYIFYKTKVLPHPSKSIRTVCDKRKLTQLFNNYFVEILKNR